MTADELVMHVEGSLALASEYEGQAGTAKVQASLTALKLVGDDKNKAASGDALRVFKEQIVVAESGVTGVVGELKALLARVRSPEFNASAASDPLQIEMAAREATDLAARPQGLFDEAVARAEHEFAKLSHDLIVFVSFDMIDRHLDGFRAKAEHTRKVHEARSTSNGVVREYEMSRSRTLRYLEVKLTPKEFDGATPPELLDAFARLTEQSKVVFLGHGSAESDGVETEGDDPEGGRLVTFQSVFKRFASEIHARTKGLFGSPTGPLLDVTLYSCQGAATRAYERDASDTIVVANGVLTRKSGEVVDARITMAGKLMIALREGGVYARVKAKATTIVSPEWKSFDVGLEGQRKMVTGYHATQERRGAGLVVSGQRGRTYAPADLAMSAAWRKKSDPNGATLATFKNANPNAKSYARDPAVEVHPYVATTTFQGKLKRRHGYKRVFTWNEDGTLRCVDIADGAEVDFIFETNKDRALWFLMGTARHLANGATWKYDAMMAMCEKLEGAANGRELAARMREIAESPTVNSHTSKVSRMLGLATRSSKVLGDVATMLAKNPPELLPMPRWEDRKLGLR
jgi:hypothetical protein